MVYAHIVAGAVAAYPYTFAMLNADNPNVSFPGTPGDDVLAVFGVYPVSSTTRPAFDAITQKVVEATPTGSGSTWTQAWSVVALSQPEIDANTQAAADAADATAAKAYAKLNALKAMTPAQISAWVDANVTNLATAQDAIKTLAIAVGILTRRL